MSLNLLKGANSPERITPARKVGTSQQQISRLESPSYEGHSLSMLRRVAEVLGATLKVKIKRKRHTNQAAVAESKADYETKKEI